ncbi:DUF1534 domain-containing protein [Pseudomonas congelans]|nr:DUF1534 domain-containing protein [Pseudomonas congelans]
MVTDPSFRTLQRGNACRDAPRHKSALHNGLKIGRVAPHARSSVGTPCVTLRVTKSAPHRTPISPAIKRFSTCRLPLKTGHRFFID